MKISLIFQKNPDRIRIMDQIKFFQGSLTILYLAALVLGEFSIRNLKDVKYKFYYSILIREFILFYMLRNI